MRRLIVLAVLVQAGAAQSTAPVVITTQSQEVLLDLVFRDKKGRLVRDVKPEEIQITDDGTPVKMISFRLNTSQSGGGSQVKTPAAPDLLREFRLVTLVFDRLSLEPGRLARDAALELIHQASGPNVYFAVLVVESRLHLLQQYTSDQTVLRTAIDAATKRAKARERIDGDQAERILRSLAGDANAAMQVQRGDLSGLNERGPERRMADMMLNVLSISESSARSVQSRPSIGALLTLAREQEALPGRKTIVYFSEGLQLTTAVMEQFRTVISAANRSNVSIYAVDATGLAVSEKNRESSDLVNRSAELSKQQVTSNGTEAVSVAQVKSGDTMEMGLRSSYQSPLQELAKETGGFVITDSNDFRKPMKKISEELSSWYEAAYSPAISSFDGHFRRISVTVNRRDVHVQSRAGYFALPSGSTQPASPHEAAMLKALSSKPLPSALPFKIAAFQQGRQGTDFTASVVFEIPASELQLDPDNGGDILRASVSVMGVIHDGSGKVVHKLMRDVAYQISKDKAELFRKETLSIAEPFALPSGNYRLQTVAFDRNGSRMGGGETDVSLMEAKAGPWISPLVLVRRLEPDANAAGGPLRFKGARVIPELSGCVAHGESATIYFTVQTSPGAKAPPGLALELSRGSEVLGRFPMTLPAGVKPGDQLPYVTSIPTSSMDAGDYVARVIVLEDGTEAEQKMGFRVEGGLAHAASATAPAPASIPSHQFAEPQPVLSVLLAPEAGEQERLIKAAREHALSYSGSLPNFSCRQITQRYLDPSGVENWRLRDTITEQLRYHDGTENYTMIAVNGQRTKVNRTEMDGTTSSGEFGNLLRAVFSPQTEALFEWKGWSGSGSDRQHVVAYKIAKTHSPYSLSEGSRRYKPAIHGLLYVDDGTQRVRRITVIAEGIPAAFPMQESTLDLEYDYAKIGNEDFLLPSQAVLRVRRGRTRLTRHEIRFRDYRMYTVESSVKFDLGK